MSYDAVLTRARQCTMLQPGLVGWIEAMVGHESRWLDARDAPSWVGEWVERDSAHGMVDIDVETELGWPESRTYEYSKLYIASDPEVGFSEERVICFRLPRREGRQLLRLVLPSYVEDARRLRFRLDPFPFCASGRFRVDTVQLVAPDDVDVDATFRAELVDLKQRVRRQVVDSEGAATEVCNHLPESLSLELTPRCNLTCGHCSSHGTRELHIRHNRMSGLDATTLARVADELFPGLTGVTLVGRGEPLLADDAVWDVLIDRLRRYDVLLRFVTNGTLLRRRLTAEVMPLIDTVTVSIDGNTDETMRVNRGGVHLETVIAGIRHFHELRRSANIARRPRLGLSWTLKRNNISELPAFIERMAEFEPDLFYSRHLLIFFEKDQGESLIGNPVLTNRYLRPAYASLDRQGIRSDCPPLMDERGDQDLEPTREPSADEPTVVRGADRCPFVHRTAVIHSNGDMPTCSVPFAAVAGNVAEEDSVASVWNGPVLRGVRAAMDTVNEWKQCQSCWYREGQYVSQRAAAADQQRFDLEETTAFTQDAWDFRDYAK